MSKIKLESVYKIYPNAEKPSVTDFNLEIDEGEFIVFVGPSGCGKSTTLRMIAGLEDISEGVLSMGGKKVNDVAPKDRDIAMVFQNYALYPHMNLYDNMAFGLKLRKFPKEEIKQRVEEAARILGLTEMLERKPKALSGGQRQRVALGRAIVRNPKVFLMDEPLSNLDAKLRVQMRAEISKLHHSLGATTIYVTHDQTEAMTMADRIVVMKDGLIQQIGTPKEVYTNPNNVFVAQFIGSPAMNTISGKMIGNDFVLGDVKLRIPDSKVKVLHEKGYDGKDIIIGVRPENIYDENIMMETYSNALLDFKIEVFEVLGAETILYSKFGGQTILAKISARTDVRVGDTVTLAVDMNKVHFFDVDTEERI